MTIGTRESLLANNKPKLKKIKIGDAEYFIREFNVGDMNRSLYGQQKVMCELAEAQGIVLNYDNPEELVKQLSKVYDPYRLARNLALRLCDADGNNLFDFENVDDLEALSRLDKSVSEELSRALMDEEPKN
ncbi:hypothetical protein [Actinobacillus pleuropneumoniae]|uniref:Uncharacterized protein n=2 Tax=Actinobacillus pleuropneumoniae TaxID=715 RepID=A3MZN4_ACTP2|nr:hypothetical protein [Actinobacillus pleuropneumoniae]ABN73620.1 hypothetical protein APL_0516 [Actinobacillus pleuropneumoniae serovar 5b str. L20]ACE61149.1 hypothetical protein APP7_0497 [Actinobacillus pleuropneumoniae serovar 7 str. AP76]MEE3682396.1 hypothetical protein [Actinobacillus pleuropneumoniae]UKH32366.1 hypothetical protein D1103_02560 [Actinobacillus pleuropneumoniae serovar 10 str. D13039]